MMPKRKFGVKITSSDSALKAVVANDFRVFESVVDPIVFMLEETVLASFAKLAAAALTLEAVTLVLPPVAAALVVASLFMSSTTVLGSFVVLTLAEVSAAESEETLLERTSTGYATERPAKANAQRV